ncbi:hypothetical protein GCM10027598_65250 [Amycolatopsis oliviviridis]|uniref:Uncharacterized protein n=1 Tax=Amycolatopsis oliviviridis TaxID=1471590 RepID=A0ABQ3MAG2_9PSEU|nr:hypothetical protein GCM10017790_78860 [Amycolatopsis oliviviridis]
MVAVALKSVKVSLRDPGSLKGPSRTRYLPQGGAQAAFRGLIAEMGRLKSVKGAFTDPGSLKESFMDRLVPHLPQKPHTSHGARVKAPFTRLSRGNSPFAVAQVHEGGLHGARRKEGGVHVLGTCRREVAKPHLED